MWAGYLALANQQGAQNGQPSLGFINPSIYQDGLGSSYTTYFHDITAGSNGFPAVTGYDLVTGWGSPNGSALINALGGPPGPSFTLSANPASLTLVQGGSGSTTISVADFDGFSGAVTLSAANVPTGVTAVFTINPATSTSTLNLTVSASAPVGTYTLLVNGVSGSVTAQAGVQLIIGYAPIATISPSSLAFGNETVGTTSKTKSFTLTNTGKAPLKFTSVTASGNFAIEHSTCSGQLGESGECIVVVTFTPTQLGALTGSVTITDNAPNSPQVVALSGTGTADATLTPATAKYPKTKAGTSSAAKTFTFSNKEKTAALTSVSASTTGNFAITSNTCTSTLAASSKCTIQVTFNPVGTGVQTGTLQVSSDAFGSPQTSTLSGTGK
jgi:hypothetical protein